MFYVLRKEMVILFPQKEKDADSRVQKSNDTDTSFNLDNQIFMNQGLETQIPVASFYHGFTSSHQYQNQNQSSLMACGSAMSTLKTTPWYCPKFQYFDTTTINLSSCRY